MDANTDAVVVAETPATALQPGEDAKESSNEAAALKLTPEAFRTYRGRAMARDACIGLQPPPRSHAVFVLDWNDTLLCSTFLNTRSMTTPLAPALKKNEGATEELLKMALRHGPTFIVTNAEKGWVDWCVALYFPALRPLLTRVPVIYAKHEYGASCPDDMKQWKLRAFQAVRHQVDARRVNNFVAMGDSDLEIDAAHSMAGEFEQATVKTLKFHGSPSPGELVQQLRSVTKDLDRVLGDPTPQRLRLKRK